MEVPILPYVFINWQPEVQVEIPNCISSGSYLFSNSELCNRMWCHARHCSRGGYRGGAKGAVAPPQPRNIGFFNTKMDPSPPPPLANVAPQARVYHEIDYKNTPKMSKTGLSAAICTRSRPFVGVVTKKWAWSIKFSRASRAIII